MAIHWLKIWQAAAADVHRGSNLNVVLILGFCPVAENCGSYVGWWCGAVQCILTLEKIL